MTVRFTEHPGIRMNKIQTLCALSFSLCSGMVSFHKAQAEDFLRVFDSHGWLLHLSEPC